MIKEKTTQKGFLLYESIAKKIIEDIKNKVFLAGQKLPSEIELCEKYKVSHLTIRRAFSFLVEKKYVIRKKNVGTFVADINITNNKHLMLDDFIVLIVTSIKGSLLTEIIDFVESEANRYGKSMILCNSHGNFSKEVSYLNDYIKKGMKKFIIVPMGSDTVFYENLRNEHKLKMIFVDTTPGECAIPTIRTDDVKGAYKVTKYLLSIGHKKIVHIPGPKNFSSTKERIKGYVKAMGKENSVVLEGAYSINGGYNVICDLISHGGKPTAVFSASDLAAIGAKLALEDLGYKVPEDVSVFGYGNIELGRNYKLSTVDQQPEFIGKMCMEVMESFIYNMKGLQKRLIIEPELIIRDSCLPRNGKREDVKQ